MKSIVTLQLFIAAFACLLSLSFAVGCGDNANPVADNSGLDPERITTGQIEREIQLYGRNGLSEEEFQELKSLAIPPNWPDTEDAVLRARYLHAQLLKQFGDIPAVHIVGANERKKALGLSVTFQEQLAFIKAQYLLWPTEGNRRTLENYQELKRLIMPETGDPGELAEIYKQRLIRQFGDIPEVHIIVQIEAKIKAREPVTTDELLAYHEARYLLWPDDFKLRRLKKYRQAKADGIPFALIEWEDGDWEDEDDQ